MKAVELFSGAGGLAIGLSEAGFDTVTLVERDKHAASTLQQNFPTREVICDDIRKLHFAEHEGKVDLVAGGPPCQPFSLGGKAKGYDDSRDMFPQAIRVVREVKPAAFVFENVRGLMRPAFENYVEYIRLQMEHPDFPISKNAIWEINLRRLQRHKSSDSESGLKYKVFIHVADAADFGVPQRRHRVFFVGFRSDLDCRWFFPTPSHSQENLLWDKWVSGAYWDYHRVPTRRRAAPSKRQQRKVDRLRSLGTHDSFVARWATVRDAFSGLGDPARGGGGDHRFQPGARVYPGHTGSPWDEPAKALKAGDHGVPGGENMLRHLNGRVRYFTVREAARIQTFPDAHQFHGPWTESMRQLVEKLDTMASSLLSQENLAALKEEQLSIGLKQGVYLLFDGDKAVYVGKAVALAQRLRKHRLKLSARKNLDMGEFRFKALLFEKGWGPAANEQLLIDYFKSLDLCAWNNDGFGPNDPGKRRDGAEPSPFDRLHPIEEALGCDYLEDEMSVKDALDLLKTNLPYLLRFQLGSGDGTTTVNLSGTERTAEAALIQIARTLGREYQLMRFASHFTLYRRDPPAAYEFGDQLCP